MEVKSIDIRPLSFQKQRANKFGDKKVAGICKKLLNGEYKDPTHLIWSLVKEDRIDEHQFKMLVNSVPNKVNVILK